MKFIKWIVWDIHKPRMRVFTTLVAIMATLPWLMMSVVGWIWTFGG